MYSKEEIKEKSFSMPFFNPTYPRGPFRFIDREYLIITYETDREALEKIIPYPLKIEQPVVKYEFIRMPNSSGFGDYTESGQVIPVTFNGKKGAYVHCMYLDSEKPIAAGREIWGFPKTFGYPSLKVDSDVLIGELFYQSSCVAQGTMVFKEEKADIKKLQKDLEEEENFLLKIIPDADGSVRICELVSYQLQDVNIKEAWKGKGELNLFHHVMAPVSHLPVKKVLSSLHFRADLTLPYGKVVFDYLR